MPTTSTEPVEHDAPLALAPDQARHLGLTKRVALRGAVIAAVVLAAGLAVPYIVLDPYYMSMLLDGLVLGMLALGIGFLARHLGLISLGHTAFFGGAAYAVAYRHDALGLEPARGRGVRRRRRHRAGPGHRRARRPDPGHGLPDADAGPRSGALPA